LRGGKTIWMDMSDSNMEKNGAAQNNQSRLPDEARRARLKTWRRAKDRFSTYGVTAGGLGVVFALALIFIYLFYEVFPLLRTASITPTGSYVMQDTDIEHFSLERYNELTALYTGDGQVRFREAADGRLRLEVQLPLPEEAAVRSFATGDPSEGLFIYGLDDGRALIARTNYLLSYPGDRRHIDPVIEYPLGGTAVEVDPEGAGLRRVAVQETGQGFSVAAATDDGRLLLAVYSATASLFTGEVSLRRQAYALPSPPSAAEKILIDGPGRSLFVADEDGYVHYYDLSSPAAARLVQSVATVPAGERITALEFLKGSVSLIVGGSDGSLSQWFLVRDAHNVQQLTRIRDFLTHAGAIRRCPSRRCGTRSGTRVATTDYVWQSSSASDEFESKFSLVPLTVGTLKAAFYAMLFAIPLAIMGRHLHRLLHDAEAARHRQAEHRDHGGPAHGHPRLPRGLWLAPFVENNLPAVFSHPAAHAGDDAAVRLSLVAPARGPCAAIPRGMGGRCWCR
jgi:ABC-type uncharacterized transport system permease subunit